MGTSSARRAKKRKDERAQQRLLEIDAARSEGAAVARAQEHERQITQDARKTLNGFIAAVRACELPDNVCIVGAAKDVDAAGVAKTFVTTIGDLRRLSEALRRLVG